MIITGTNGNDRGPTALVGTDFADTINGLAGNDELYGHGGNDISSAELGADTIDGGAGIDLISHTNASGKVSVYLDFAQVTKPTGIDKLYNVENAWGSAFGDYLYGDEGANALSGFGGDDALSGGAGADQLSGGAGSDLALYGGSTAGVTIESARPASPQGAMRLATSSTALSACRARPMATR